MNYTLAIAVSIITTLTFVTIVAIRDYKDVVTRLTPDGMTVVPVPRSQTLYSRVTKVLLYPLLGARWCSSSSCRRSVIDAVARRMGTNIPEHEDWILCRRDELIRDYVR